MDKNKKIIFISTFVIVLLVAIGVYLWVNRATVTKTGTDPWYQSFNPFGTGQNTDTNNDTDTNTTTTVDENGNIISVTDIENSKFHQITDFAVAGASFFEETRPIAKDTIIPEPKEPEEIKTIISANTKEGKKDIQTFLNNTLSIKPPLVVDGVFGKKVTQAIKDFQKANNLKITGLVDAETAPYLIKITKSSAPIVKSEFEEAPSIRYTERKNGHIYRMFLDTKIKEKVSNATIPNIYEAIFAGTGKTVLYRYLSEKNLINSFISTIGAVAGEFLPQNISDASISLNKEKLFYLTENSDGVTGTIEILGDGRKNIVFVHPFTEWISQWDNKENIYLTTKSSSSVNGSIFMLNSTKKTIKKLFGGVAGLTTLVSPDGSSVLYSYTTNSGPKLGVLNVKEYKTTNLDVYGLAEKCVWSSDNINVYCGVPGTIEGNEYPDIWYQGLSSFDDFFNKINTSTLEKYTIADSRDETRIDATYLFLDKEENSLFFINKKDSTLWSLDLK